MENRPMKQLSLFLISLSLLLPACTQQHETEIKHTAPMLQLQLLLTQAASLATLPGESVRNHALELARRAMSGPEMNAMHHGGAADQPMMKATHDLGDAIFELLDAAPQAINNEHLQLAAQAAQMRLSGKILTDDTAAFMQKQGRALLTNTAAPTQHTGNSAYDKAAAHLLTLLRQTG